MDSTTPQRLAYIDISRAIGMLSVVIGHMNQFYRDSLRISHPQMLAFIYTFHMPLFYILTGILFSEKTYKHTKFTNFLFKKIKTLIIPYLFLDISGGLYYVLKNGSGIDIKSIYSVCINTITIHPNVGADWFIPALFIGEIILFFFLRFYKPIYRYIVWIPFLMIYLYYPFSTHWIYVTVRGIVAFTFMLSGYFLKGYFKSDINKRWDVIILSFILTYAISIFNGQIDLWGNRIGNPFLCLAGGLVGSYWIIGTSKNISSKLLIFIGQNTITMMGTHMICVTLIWSFLTSTLFIILPTWSSNAYGAITLFFFVIAANLPILYLYDRYLPFLIGKKKNRTPILCSFASVISKTHDQR